MLSRTSGGAPWTSSATRGQSPRVLRRFVSITTGIVVNHSYGITPLGPAAVWLWPGTAGLGTAETEKVTS